MRFASFRQQAEFHSPQLDRTLRVIAEELDERAVKETNQDVFVTSVYRTHEEDRAVHGSGIHTEWRAVDVRTSDRPVGEWQALVAWVNEHWRYGNPIKPWLRVAYAQAHGTGPHLHLQVHPRTRRR